MDYNYTALGFLFYTVILISIIWISSRRSSASAFLIAERKVGTFRTLASLVAGMRDGAGLAAWISLAYLYGFGTFSMTVGLSCALLILAIFAPTLRRLGEERGYLSITDVIRDYVGSRTAQATSFIILVTAFLIAAAQLYVAGRLLGDIAGGSSQAGIFLAAFLVAVYITLGGYRTVTATDVFEFLVIMSIAVLPFLIGLPDGEMLAPKGIAMPADISLSLTLIAFMIVLCIGDVWQRIFSSRSGQTARKGLIIAVPVYALISFGLILIGFSLREILPTVPVTDVFFAAFTTPAIDAPWRALLAVFTVAATLSTLDTQVFLFSSTLLRWVHSARKQDFSDQQQVRFMRRSVWALLAVLVILSSLIQNIIAYLFGACTLVTILLPVVIYALLSLRKPTLIPKRDEAVFIILLAVGALYAAMFIGGAFVDMRWTIFPGALATVLFLAAKTKIKF
ncbi:MAG: sodium:solute symporter [Dongiaceae bacterium]